MIIFSSSFILSSPSWFSTLILFFFTYGFPLFLYVFFILYICPTLFPLFAGVLQLQFFRQRHCILTDLKYIKISCSRIPWTLGRTFAEHQRNTLTHTHALRLVRIHQSSDQNGQNSAATGIGVSSFTIQKWGEMTGFNKDTECWMFLLKGSDDGVLHSELLGSWTLSIVRYSRN
jgi:hypothetical protein